MKVPVYGFSILPGSVSFAHLKEQVAIFAKSEGFPKEESELGWPIAPTLARTTWIPGSHNAIVSLNVVACREKTLTQNQIRSLLSHEAVHVVQHLFEEIGEKSPGIESQAYFVQAVTQFLLNQYDLVRIRKRKVKK